MKINLGCGTGLRPGWVNVDIRDDVGADVVWDITSGLPFADNRAESVVAQDVLEHLTVEQQQQVLAEIWRVLRPKGKLEVRLPNVDAIISRFATDAETRNLFLYGDTSQSGVWGAHKSGHTLKSFTTLARMVGLRLISWQALDTNLVFELQKSVPVVRPRRLVFINQSLGMGGAETFNLELLQWLKKQGTRVEAWVTHPQFVAALSGRVSRVHRLPVVLDVIGNWKGLVKAAVLFPWGLVMYAAVTWHCRRKDLIVLTGFIEKILVTPLAKLWGIPVVWVEFGPLTAIFAKFGGLPKLLYRLVSHFPDIVVMPSVHTSSVNVALGHISAARVRLIPCGVAVKPRWAITDANLVVCVSRLEAGKGQDLLIAAWQKVVRQVPGTRLRIVGEGEQFSNLKSQVSNLNLDGSVKLTGWVKNSLTEMAKSEIVVFPTLWPLEGFGMVAVEAMSQAKPVIGFDFGPVPEIVTGECGLLVPPGDTSALAGAIVDLLKHPAKAKRLGQAGRKRYLTNYTLNQVGPQYLQVFKYVLANNSVK